MKATITIPYAVADFAEMRERGFYYVDKTKYISPLQSYKAPVFLRPRRFGKSLLGIYTAAHYYDRTLAHRFEELFGGTYIGSQPTPEHNQYMVIRYDFSKMVMSNSIEGLEQNFNDLNCSPVEIMVTHNRDLFGDFQFNAHRNASKMLEEVLEAKCPCTRTSQKSIFWIDEYDNFRQSTTHLLQRSTIRTSSHYLRQFPTHLLQGNQSRYR
ncbi:MAG: AAA family ATPase [Bacteroides cellulosilyticus]